MFPVTVAALSKDDSNTNIAVTSSDQCMDLRPHLLLRFLVKVEILRCVNPRSRSPTKVYGCRNSQSIVIGRPKMPNTLKIETRYKQINNNTKRDLPHITMTLI
jgi:hypothetical protein